MHVHILGICGTFMGGIAMIAKQAGFRVTGSDLNVYPPMSDELSAAGIEIYTGFGAEQLDEKPDLIVVGNVMKRGMPVIERMLNERFRYVSGPAFLEDMYLLNKTVLAVAGTHGKTTTSSMLAWILEYNGKNPGFLIGGIPENFGISARSTDSPYFVIEADEYDSAFFDKRSKFVHYHPDIALINNIEFDHADIFNSVEEIEKQFHHMIRTVPSEGTVIYPADDKNACDAVNMGVWSHTVKAFSDGCPYDFLCTRQDGSAFEVIKDGARVALFELPSTGLHNACNAFMAMLAAERIGITPAESAEAMKHFKMPKRRMELVAEVDKYRVYDDFAHHPTAIAVTLQGLRAREGKDRRIVCVFEPRSNSMKMGANRENLGAAFADADEIFVLHPKNVHWDMDILVRDCPKPLHIVDGSVQELIDKTVESVLKAEDSVTVIMSNGGFENMRSRLPEALRKAVLSYKD